MKKPGRIPTPAAPEAPLQHSPFAGLGTPLPPQAQPAPAAPKQKPAHPFQVTKSRKGHWPIQIERRAGGKSVTVIGNVTGDADALLRALRKHCGAGGVAREGLVEIQGDQTEKVQKFLDSLR